MKFLNRTVNKNTFIIFFIRIRHYNVLVEAIKLVIMTPNPTEIIVIKISCY